MNKEFYAGNRKSLYQKLEAGSLVVVFSGHAPIKTNDENYPFFTNRNFLYLTGIEQENIVLMAYVGEGTIEETLYLLPPDAFAERWTGRRIKEEEAEELSGITNYKYVAAFRNDFSRQLFSGNVKKVYLDFDKVYENTPGSRSIPPWQVSERTCSVCWTWQPSSDHETASPDQETM